MRAALAADTGHAIKAVGVVHNETSTGMMIPIPEVRAALDATGHPALLLADTISSLGSLDFRMDEWGVDAAVGGSQKGLMLPTGLSFTGVSHKALKAHESSKLPKHYFSWSAMMKRPLKSFLGTVPTSFFFGLQELLRLMEQEEGLENVFARHTRLATAVRAAVQHWSGNNGPQLFCTNPGRLSDSVTAVLMPEGIDGDAFRRVAMQRFNVSLGGGLGPLARQGVPHRPSRRPERADDPRHAGDGGAGDEGRRRAAYPGRGGCGDRRAGLRQGTQAQERARRCR